MESESEIKKDFSEINEENYKKICDLVEEFSASLTERAILHHVSNALISSLDIDPIVIRKVLLYSLKIFRERNDILLQKFSLLDRGKRDSLIILLKNTIAESFIPIFTGEKQKKIKNLIDPLDFFFDSYLEF